MFQVPGEVAQFEGTIYLPKTLLATSRFQDEYTSFQIVKYMHYLIWITGIVAIIALFTTAKPSLREFEVFEKAERVFSIKMAN